MKRPSIAPGVLALTTLGGVFVTGTVSAQRVHTISLSAGTVLPVKLNEALSSNKSQRGDRFMANVEDRKGYGALRGAKVEGVVTSTVPKKGDRPGKLELSFSRLITPNGKSYAIRGSVFSLDNKSVETRDDGRMVAKPGHRN